MRLFTISFLSLAGALLAQTPHPAPVPGAKPAPPATAAPATPAAPAAPVTPVAPDPNKVILTVGTEKITVAQYDQMINALPAQLQTAARGPQKRQFAEQLINLKLLSQEAVKRKIDQKPTVQQQLAFQRDNILAGAVYQDMADTAKVDDAAARKYYDEHKSEYEQVKARHILIRMKGSPVPANGKKELTDEEALAKAQEIRKRLQAGEDFEKVAKAESDDTGSGANGGDLGFFKHGQMVPQFEQAAFAMEKGQLSEPIKTQFGYHLIKVEDKQAKTFEEVRPEIEKRLRPDIAKQQMDEFRKKSTVVIDDGFFGPAAPAANLPTQ